MHLKFGVIGPAESVEKILEVGKEFETITFLPFPYEEIEEMSEIIEINRYVVDQWLFSGLFNYTYAMENKLIQKDEGGYPTLYGSSFFGELLEAQLNEGRIFTKISIDNIARTELDKILSFYHLDALTYYTMPFQSDYSRKDVITFHKKLYDEGKIELAITTLNAVYYQLKEAGVPVYRLTASYMSIKLTIELLVEKAQANLFENRQMAIIGCRLKNAEKTMTQHQLFQWKYHQLNWNKSLLEITELLQGSLVEEGDGLFFIFTTKGEIDNQAESALLKLIEEYQIRDQLEASIAIGFGENVLHAEQNVRYGLSQDVYEKEASILLVEGAGELSEKSVDSLGKSLDLKSLEEELTRKFADGSASPRDVLRIIVYSHKYHQQEFTSEDISRWLQSTERNGRRILAELEQANIIKKCGKIQSNQRGRPKNVYCFIDDNLLQLQT
ncbi:hypothetical protein [Oceanobacillus timonensis]|uniref:hypothetical protein n=1 Tax=Oceanobacillus timonensis TaxID=1926285 RepID=UPI0009B9984B|nr:hypothetical protein [Oceanobacillus timonensis]